MYSEVAALTGVRDAHGPRQEQACSQDLQATPETDGGSKGHTRQLPPRPEPQDAVPVGHVQGQRLPGGVVHHSIVALEESRSVGVHRVATDR